MLLCPLKKLEKTRKIITDNPIQVKETFNYYVDEMVGGPKLFIFATIIVV